MQKSESGPMVVHRACGGWLAFAPTGSELRIGVTADSEREARNQYAETVARWRAMLTEKPPRA